MICWNTRLRCFCKSRKERDITIITKYKFHYEFITAKSGFLAINCKMQIGNQPVPISVNSKGGFKKVEKQKVYYLGKPAFSKTDDFLENFQTASDPPFPFSENILQFFQKFVTNRMHHHQICNEFFQIRKSWPKLLFLMQNKLQWNF